MKAIDTSMKNFGVNQFHQLSENRASGIHPYMVLDNGSGLKYLDLSSNRSHLFIFVTSYLSVVYRNMQVA